MQQQWDLGQALRRRYDGFLNASYNRQEVGALHMTSGNSTTYSPCSFCAFCIILLYPNREEVCVVILFSGLICCIILHYIGERH